MQTKMIILWLKLRFYGLLCILSGTMPQCYLTYFPSKWCTQPFITLGLPGITRASPKVKCTSDWLISIKVRRLHPARLKCLAHEKRCWSEGGMTMTLPSRHWVAILHSIPATVTKPAKEKCFNPVSDVGTKVIQRWSRVTSLLSMVVHTKEARPIRTWEQPTEWRKPESKTTANQYQAQNPSSGTMCAVHIATVTVIAAFHLSTPVGGDTPGLWLH